MSTLQRVVDGKYEDIEYNLNLDEFPEALARIMELYTYLETQIPVVKDAVQHWQERTTDAEQALGDLFAVVDAFIVTEKHTIRQAYAEVLTEEEIAQLEAECDEDNCCCDDNCWECPVEHAEREAAAFNEALRIIE